MTRDVGVSDAVAISRAVRDARRARHLMRDAHITAICHRRRWNGNEAVPLTVALHGRQVEETLEQRRDDYARALETLILMMDFDTFRAVTDLGKRRHDKGGVR